MTKEVTIQCSGDYSAGSGNNKISIIKSIRVLTGLDLKTAKDMSENTNPQLLTIYSGFPEFDIERELLVLRNNGVHVGGTVRQLIEDLRALAVQALQAGEDELANEILQLALAEKLRRKNDML